MRPPPAGIDKPERALETTTFEQPGAIAKLFEGQERLAQFFDRRKESIPEQVLFQGADEPLGTAVALWLPPTESRRASCPKKKQFVLEDIREVCVAMIGSVLTSPQPPRPCSRKSTPAGLGESTPRLQNDFPTSPRECRSIRPAAPFSSTPPVRQSRTRGTLRRAICERETPQGKRSPRALASAIRACAMVHRASPPSLMCRLRSTTRSAVTPFFRHTAPRVR